MSKINGSSGGSGMDSRFVYFSDTLIALNREIANHPLLMSKLDMLPQPADFELRMAAVAAYAGIVVDGYFSAEGIDKLAEACIEKLRKARTIILN